MILNNIVKIRIPKKKEDLIEEFFDKHENFLEV